MKDACSCVRGAGRNPILPPGIHMADGEAHVFNGRLYLYGSLDEATDHFCSPEYRTAWTDDMKAWHLGGASFSESQVPWAGQSVQHSSLDGVKSYEDLPAHIKTMLPPGSESLDIKAITDAVKMFTEKSLPSKRILYAPDAAEKDGKYYLYFCLSDDSEGVAVADSPEGPFTGAVRIPVQGIDPAVFVDEDGTAYYFWGQMEACGARLADGMMSLDEGSVVKGIVTEKGHCFHEGSSVRKINGMYYYVFADSSRGKPACLGYATSSSPLGPYTYRGVIIDNSDCDPQSWNNHGSIQQFRGQWYVFYHRSSRRSDKMRRMCCEPIQILEDGTIPEVMMTSQGAGEPFTADERISASAACALKEGCWLDEAKPGEGSVLNKPGEESIFIEGGGEAVFRYISLKAGNYTLKADCTGSINAAVLLDGVRLSAGSLPDIPVHVEKDGTYELRLELGASGPPAEIRSLEFCSLA